MIGVVADLIRDRDKFTICQCPTHKAGELLWELGSEMVEPEETREQALVREF